MQIHKNTLLTSGTTKLHNFYFRGCLELAKLRETRLIKVKRKKVNPDIRVAKEIFTVAQDSHC